jgi:hypothetical protein
MIEKLEKLLDLLIEAMEMYLGRGPKMGETEIEKAERKVKKTRVPKAEAPKPVENQGTGDNADQPIEDQLGLGPDPVAPEKVEAKKELTEKESAEQLEPKTKQFITITKNDKPEEGKTRAIRMLNTDPRFMVGKLADLTHAQRVLWIAEMEKGIEAHK